MPIGRGQRELIIGDRRPAKPPLPLTPFSPVKGQNVLCIYVAIGRARHRRGDRRAA
ncbi:MAG: hypothetical protein ACLUN6_04100 [Holdemanella sp.]|uniref:hypothetical protein n=1 Tax=Holdemanella sp. TaxID=1971762 RepID=UPI003991E538